MLSTTVVLPEPDFPIIMSLNLWGVTKDFDLLLLLWAGLEYSIREFHKPTIEKLEELQTDRKNQMNALTTKIEDLINTSATVSTPLALEDIEEARKKKALYVETDTDLDADF
ncbi:uncharacterized protein CEXT_460631 [Caerostris extrusa]|uniref:Uncharacterized protein n=1 Tax=Caerostris extrusa TaxID=172846 RepID=A0AAV4SUN3_CAEEX|nr:uncharacterized protein CEXT_460631 [Caerostris extrusa]